MSLSDQHSIERIAVMNREARCVFGMCERDSELLEPTLLYSRLDRPGIFQATKSCLDRRFPGACSTDEYRLRL